MTRFFNVFTQNFIFALIFYLSRTPQAKDSGHPFYSSIFHFFREHFAHQADKSDRCYERTVRRKNIWNKNTFVSKNTIRTCTTVDDVWMCLTSSSAPGRYTARYVRSEKETVGCMWCQLHLLRYITHTAGKSRNRQIMLLRTKCTCHFEATHLIRYTQFSKLNASFSLHNSNMSNGFRSSIT